MPGSLIKTSVAVATTSGTSIDFTSIPSWVKRITVMFAGVSTNGTSIPQLQIGTGSIDATGYLGSGGYGPTFGASNNTTGFILFNSVVAASVMHGTMTLTTMGSNIWVMSGAMGTSNLASAGTAGFSKTLSGTLDRLRLTTVNGTDTFDAGSINILYE
jgi:hypothetical protein